MRQQINILLHARIAQSREKQRERREMGERNVVRTAEVYRAYSGIAAATVSGVLRMSPMARERSTSAAWPSRSVAFVS